MAVSISPVGRGTIAGDGTGDTPRVAFGKTNDNDTALKAAADLVLDVPQNSILGRATASTGDVEQLSSAQVKTILGYGELSQAETVVGFWDFQGDLKSDFISESTVAAGVTIEGVLLKDNTITSRGVDDNTTVAGGGISISNEEITIGSAGIGVNQIISSAATGGNSTFQLGMSDNNALRFHFGTHGTLANDITFYSNGLNELNYDFSADLWDFRANAITTTGTISGSNLSGSNTGDQTNLTGISDTKANFNSSCSDGTFLFVGDITEYDFWDKVITIESPAQNDDITWFFTNRAITCTELRLVNKEGTAGSCVITIRHGADRNAAGTIVYTGTITSNTTGHDITTFSDATIPADSFVWVEIGTTTDTLEVHGSLIGTID